MCQSGGPGASIAGPFLQDEHFISLSTSCSAFATSQRDHTLHEPGAVHHVLPISQLRARCCQRQNRACSTAFIRGSAANAAMTLCKCWISGRNVAPRFQQNHLVWHVRSSVAARRTYSSDSDHSHDVAILGGGITGLSSAYYLTRELPNAKITIYEASDRLGGWLSSKRVPVKDGSILFEAGPRTLRPSSNGVLSARLVRRKASKGVSAYI